VSEDKGAAPEPTNHQPPDGPAIGEIDETPRILPDQKPKDDEQ
jgi:hypothetical protein